MPTTEHIHLPLYTDEETPDLSTTGHYNHAMEIIDANIGELEAQDAKLAEDLADEREARTDADTALGARIDTAETEISANSADLTGIKGLTYGSDYVNFLESSNGEYTSPALDEIAEQIAQGMTCIQIQADATTMDADSLNKLSSNWPNVALIDTTPDPNDSRHEFKLPLRESHSNYTFIAIGGHYREGYPYATNVVIKKTGEITRKDVTNDPYWSNIIDKPFATIGTGLKVVSDALTVDASTISAGITGNTTWGEIEATTPQV